MTEVVTGEPARPVDADEVVRSRASTIRAIASVVVALVAIVVAVLFADHGVRIDTFPAYVAGDTETHIKQFSGPWITGAFGLIALAGLLIVAAISDLRPPRRAAGEASVDAAPEVGDPVPESAVPEVGRPDGIPSASD